MLLNVLFKLIFLHLQKLGDKDIFIVFVCMCICFSYCYRTIIYSSLVCVVVMCIKVRKSG